MSQDIRDPFDVTDESDPFATADEAASHAGPFVPWPKIDAVTDRLIVLVPRTFDKEAKVSEYAQREHRMGPTQEEWRTDLVVLDGGTLSYPYKAKDPNTEGAFINATHVIEELPALIPNWRVSAGNIIGTLNRIAEGPKPFALGRIRAGYVKKSMDAGKTFEDFAAEQEAFYANPKGKTQPKAVWHLVVSDDPQDRAVALAWWKVAQASGFKTS